VVQPNKAVVGANAVRTRPVFIGFMPSRPVIPTKSRAEDASVERHRKLC
jgi:hypothetical protein